MTRKKESGIRLKIVQHLKAIGASAHVYHASIYGERGHADVYGTYHGKSFYLEVKPPGWEPRSRQESERHVQQLIWLERERKHGAVTGVVHSPEEAEILVTDGGNFP